MKSICTTILKRFWENVEIKGADECWNWKGYRFGKGYGQFYLYNRRTIGAHRFSYLLKCGILPDDMLVLHKCDNPMCVNPDHLFLGNNQDNMTDKKLKGRCNAPRGSNHVFSKLNEEQVQNIRYLRNVKKLLLRDIAEMYDIHIATVSDIALNKRWKHLRSEYVSSN